MGCSVRRANRRCDGTGNITRSATPRAVRVFTPRPEDAGAYRGAQGSGQGNGDSELAIVAPPNYRGRGRIASAPAWGAESAIARWPESSRRHRHSFRPTPPAVAPDGMDR